MEQDYFSRRLGEHGEKDHAGCRRRGYVNRRRFSSGFVLVFMLSMMVRYGRIVRVLCLRGVAGWRKLFAGQGISSAYR